MENTIYIPLEQVKDLNHYEFYLELDRRGIVEIFPDRPPIRHYDRLLNDGAYRFTKLPEPIEMAVQMPYPYRGYEYPMVKVLFPVKKQRTMYLHRLIWMKYNGAVPNGMVVDHVNEDKLDYRLANLQLLTRSQNILKGLAHRKLSLIHI